MANESEAAISCNLGDPRAHLPAHNGHILQRANQNHTDSLTQTSLSQTLGEMYEPPYLGTAISPVQK